MRVKQCCCGCSLRDGCMIIGILKLIVLSICIILTVLSLVLPNFVAANCSDINNDDSKDLPYNEDDRDQVNCFSVGTAVLSFDVFAGVALVFMVLDLIMNSLLVHGAKKGSPDFLLPWIIWNVIMITINSVLAVITLVFGIPIAGLVQVFNILFLQAYPIIVVRSHRDELKAAPPAYTQFGDKRELL